MPTMPTTPTLHLMPTVPTMPTHMRTRTIEEEQEGDEDR